MLQRVTTYLNTHTEAAPLAAFRVLFGLMMAISLVRFWYHGWIEKLYINPSFHFKYYGFSWVQSLGEWNYLLFSVCLFASLGIAFGYKYRLSAIAFFLSFTYIELIDKTTYLNHYYFISLVAFLMIFLPANTYASIDAKRDDKVAHQFVPNWTIASLKLMISIVYFYAGLAKLNYDWLVEAIPLKIWLPGRYDLPLLGDFLEQSWVHYAFSWGGAVYDLAIPFLLLYRPTRTIAFVLVVVFHLLTRALFPIGMFPYIMIVGATIFFSSGFHKKWLNLVLTAFGTATTVFDNGRGVKHFSLNQKPIITGLFSVFFCLQLLMPFRYLLYPGHLFWTEEGYRYSWRVMLMEKAGTAQFKIVDGQTGKRFYVRNRDFLTSFQEKQMATQADFVIEYAHYLGKHFSSQGHQNVEVYVESFVALNGRKSQPYIDPTINLLTVEDGFSPKEIFLPFEK